MHDICMATKTISLEMDAYEKLRRARREPRESFSNVVRRAHWDDVPPSCRDLLRGLRSLAATHPEMLLEEDALKAIERRKRSLRRKTRWEK